MHEDSLQMTCWLAASSTFANTAVQPLCAAILLAVLSDALDDLTKGGLSSIVAHAVAYLVRAQLMLMAAD
jgi:hypothetical protein